MSFKCDGKYLMVNAIEKGWSAEGCKEQRNVWIGKQG